MGIKLSSGPNATLIAYLRERGGSTVVNCAELSRQNNFNTTSIYSSAVCLEKAGLLTIQKNGHKNPPGNYP